VTRSLKNRIRSGTAASALVCALALAGCAENFSRDPDDICAFLASHSGWFKALEVSASRWNVSESMILAFLQHESLFDAEARPPRRRILWIIPGPRRSSAYGYAQALDSTWEEYIKSTGNKGADRDDFDDAVDFVGWYATNTTQSTGVPRSDVYNQYLAYHEGAGGFRRGSYKKKKWLVKVAKRIEQKSRVYAGQLANCTDEQRRKGKGWWPFG